MALATVDNSGDLAPAVSVIRRALADANASPQTRMELRFPERRHLLLFDL